MPGFWVGDIVRMCKIGRGLRTQQKEDEDHKPQRKSFIFPAFSAPRIRNCPVSVLALILRRSITERDVSREPGAHISMHYTKRQPFVGCDKKGWLVVRASLSFCQIESDRKSVV